MQYRPLPDRIRAVMEGAAAILLLTLMLIVLVDVLMRNLLNQPLPWGTELLEVMLGFMVFLLYPVLAIGGGHITVDLIPVRASVYRMQGVLAAFAGALLFALIAWCLGRQAMRAAGYGEGTPLLHIPYSAVLGGMAALAGLASLAFVVAAVKSRKRALASTYGLSAEAV